MKQRYRLIRRGERGAKFYWVDGETGRRTSLGTASEAEARQIVLAKNQALRQPALNLHIALAYLAGSDAGAATRTWRQAMEQIVASKSGANQLRWRTAVGDKALAELRPRILIETRPEHLLAAVRQGTVSTNIFLRRLHSFCLDMGWLPWPLIPRRQWPAVRFKPKRAITREEHEAIIARESNAEARAFYKLAGFVGGSQSDLATLHAENICWETRTISYSRGKTGSRAQMHFGEEAAQLLRRLAAAGPLFPRLAVMHERHRANEFHRRCAGLGIRGVSLHSYRYAWAERARSCGYPERFAREAFGHNRKAVHRANARNAQVTVPSLEEYENKRADKKVIPFPLNRPTAPTSTTQDDHPVAETPSESPASAPPALASALPWRNAG